MENKCLEKTLKGIVNDNNLLKIGEVRFTMESNGKIIIGTTSTAVVTILTPGVTFTNPGLEGETTQTVTSAGARLISVSGNCTVSVLNKYDLIRLDESSVVNTVSCDITQLEYCDKLTNIVFTGTNTRGCIDIIKNMTKLNQVKLTPQNYTITGNLDNIPNAPDLWGLYITDSSLTGNISNLSKLPALTDLNLRSSNIGGNVSVFSSLTDIRDIILYGCDGGITGSISAFANHSALRTLDLEGSLITVSGNLGEIVNTPALKTLSLPSTVLYTAADASAADTLLQGNGGTLQPGGHYFKGGTLVESYS